MIPPLVAVTSVRWPGLELMIKAMCTLGLFTLCTFQGAHIFLFPALVDHVLHPPSCTLCILLQLEMAALELLPASTIIAVVEKLEKPKKLDCSAQMVL